MKTRDTGSRDSLATRHSLIGRLINMDDREGWSVFYETYWGLIYSSAVRAGLNREEAEDAVQETIISVSKAMPTFKYDSTRGSFRTWLMRLTAWRIKDQYRKRLKNHAIPSESFEDNESSSESSANEMDLIPGISPALEKLWEAEWEKNLLAAALERVRHRTSAKNFQLFQLLVLEEWPISKITKVLRVSPARVYLARHSVKKLLSSELIKLKRAGCC